MVIFYITWAFVIIRKAMKKKRIVVIGGGTGTFTVLRGLKEYPGLSIAAIINMADDGGSAKILRDEFRLLPTSGVRQCIVSLSEEEGLMRKLFNYRYHQGTGIAGMTFGNLFMAALADIVGTQKQAIKETCRILGVKGSIFPVSYEKISLLAEYQDGTEVLGEHYIDVSSKKVAKQRIKQFRTVPTTKIDPEAKKAIEDADLIVLGPGDLYTNTIATLVVRGVKEAIKKSKAKVVLVMNLMTKLGENYGYKATDFIVDIGKYLPARRLDYVVINTDYLIDRTKLHAYGEEGASLVEDDLEVWEQENPTVKIFREKLIAKERAQPEKGDKTARSIIRHDSNKLAKILVNLS